MFYDFAVLVPAGTLESNPVVKTLKLTAGIIVRVDIGFPRGCNGYVYCRIKHEEHQILPNNPDQVFRWDGETIECPMYLPLVNAPFTLKAEAYSPSAIYEHTLSIRVAVMREEEMYPTTGVMGALRKFLKLVGVG